jgi:periplasmic protein TonB
MILPMKRTVFALLIFVGLLSVARGQQSAADNAPPPPAKSGSKATPPQAIETPNPEPTTDAGNGPTVLWLIVDSEGRPHDVKVIKSSGSSQADANALAAVRKWRFKPAMKDGVPVKVQINVVVNARHN